MVQDLLYPKSGDYVICKYDDKVWVAFTSSYDEEFDDFKVKLLYPSGYNVCMYVLFIFILHSRDSKLYRYILDATSALAWELPFPRYLGHLSST